MKSPSDPNIDSAADRALQRMARGVVPLESPERLGDRRGRLVPSLSAFAGAVLEARRRRRAWVVSIAAAAAIAVLSGAALRAYQLREAPPRAVASVRAKAGEVRLSRGGAAPGPIGTTSVELVASDSVETGDSRAEVNLGSGALVELDSRTRLDLGPDAVGGQHREEHLDVLFGRIAVRVPKLPSGSKLTVATPNAKVTVHGTEFDVVVSGDSGGATTTTVVVRDGRVSVESEGREIILGAGSNWSSSAALDHKVASNPGSAASTSAEVARAPVPSSAHHAARSTLARENALFRSAMTARQQGDPVHAIQMLDQLIVQFPDTPLAEAAKEERARAASELEHGRGGGN